MTFTFCLHEPMPITDYHLWRLSQVPIKLHTCCASHFTQGPPFRFGSGGGDPPNRGGRMGGDRGSIGMEWNELLKISPSLLGGRTASGNNQLPPGPGQIPCSHDREPIRLIMVLPGITSPLLAAFAMPALSAMQEPIPADIVFSNWINPYSLTSHKCRTKMVIHS